MVRVSLRQGNAQKFFTAPAGYEIGFANNGATLNVMKPTIVAIAEWKGNVGGGGFQDPANWTCYSAGGSLIENGVPGEDTVKYILDADADWTATNLTFAAGVTLSGVIPSANFAAFSALVRDLTNGAAVPREDASDA